MAIAPRTPPIHVRSTFHGPPAADDVAVTGRTDGVIHALVMSQYGVVARRQLLAAGMTVHTIDHRVRSGRLRPLYRGVYQVGPALGRFGREAAAVLAAGEGAALSHRTAAELWGLLPRRAASCRIHVSVERGHPCRAAELVRVHRFVSFPSDERAIVEGLPATSAARTLLDIASSMPARALERALARAARRRLADPPDIEKLLARQPHRSGAPLLRSLLADTADAAARTRSEAESRFLMLVRTAQLSQPLINAPVEGYEVDFLWRRERLVVEMDGVGHHSSSEAFERDRRRDSLLTAAGFRVMRVTWRQLIGEPEALLVRLAQALARASRA